MYLFEQLTKQKEINKKILLEFFLITIGVILCYSRAGWGNFILGIIIIWIINRPKNNKNMILIMAIIIIIFMFISINWSSGNPYIELLKQRTTLQYYDADRFSFHDKVIEILNQSILFGIGPGNYEAMNNGWATHSLYLRMIGERGIIGSSIFFGFLLYIIKCGLGCIKKERAFLFSATIGILVNSCVIDSIHWRQLWMLFAMVIATSKIKLYNFEKE